MSNPKLLPSNKYQYMESVKIFTAGNINHHFLKVVLGIFHVTIPGIHKKPVNRNEQRSIYSYVNKQILIYYSKISFNTSV